MRGNQARERGSTTQGRVVTTSTEALRERRKALLAAYQNAEGPEQIVELQHELDEVTQRLKAVAPAREPAKRSRRGWTRDGRTAAAGRDH